MQLTRVHQNKAMNGKWSSMHKCTAFHKLVVEVCREEKTNKHEWDLWSNWFMLNKITRFKFKLGFQLTLQICAQYKYLFIIFCIIIIIVNLFISVLFICGLSCRPSDRALASSWGPRFKSGPTHCILIYFSRFEIVLPQDRSISGSRWESEAGVFAHLSLPII